jgi:hypothetical protein
MRANWISARPSLEPEADGPSLVVTFENDLFCHFATPNVWCDALRARLFVNGGAAELPSSAW